MQAISAMLSSRKAIVLFLTLGLAAVAVATGKASWEQVEAFAKYIIITWMGSQALEDAAKHNAAKVPQPAPVQDVTVNNTTVPPPAMPSDPDA